MAQLWVLRRLQRDKPLSAKIERHRSVYLAAVRSAGDASIDLEMKARLETIKHVPLNPEEEYQKLLYMAGFLIASKGSLNPEEMELLLSGSISLPGP